MKKREVVLGAQVGWLVFPHANFPGATLFHLPRIRLTEINFLAVFSSIFIRRLSCLRAFFEQPLMN